MLYVSDLKAFHISTNDLSNVNFNIILSSIYTALRTYGSGADGVMQ
jgi:hypothetical protein